MRLQLYVALSFSLALSLPFSVSLSPCYAVVLHLLLASGKEARANPSAITAATATGSCTLNLTPFANLSSSLGQKLTHRAHTHRYRYRYFYRYRFTGVATVNICEIRETLRERGRERGTQFQLFWTNSLTLYLNLFVCVCVRVRRKQRCQISCNYKIIHN